MTKFPASIRDYWRRVLGAVDAGEERSLSCRVSRHLNAQCPAMMLEGVDGSIHMAVEPELAERIGLCTTADQTIDTWYEGLARMGLALHDPDYLFYLPDGLPTVPDRTTPARRLTEADRDVFEAFLHKAPEQDRDDAFVELDHWAVYGAFDRDRLVSASSAILWTDSPIADLGVLTIPEARGRGFAKAAVLAMSHFCRT